MNYFYRATQNSDLTGGKGHNVTIACFDNEEAAVEAVRGRGVMGVGDGTVYRVPVFSSYDEVREILTEQEAARGRRADFATLREELVWGYRRDWAGQWGYGWADNRDAPVNDPEYAEFLRLQKKFGGVQS